MTRQELRLEALKLAVSCALVESQQGVDVDPVKIEKLADRYVGYVEHVEAATSPAGARYGETSEEYRYRTRPQGWDGGESHRFPPNKSDPLGEGPRGFKVSGP